MKLKFLAGCALFATTVATAQVQYTAGPALDNDKDNKMNRMLGGDDNSFYAYRVRSKGKGTSFFIEKYDKKTLKPQFSKEVNLDEENNTKIEDVEYAQGNVFVFRRQYDKKADKMTLFFQTVSSTGAVSNQLKEILTVSADHYEFVDFEIFPNPSQTKFLIKASHKATKDDDYKTDFILMDAVGMKKLWTKTVNQQLHSGGFSYNFFSGAMHELEGVGFIGLYLDDKDNIYWCYNSLTKTSTDKVKRYRVTLYTMNSADNTPKSLELTFDDDYLVSDIEFSKSNENEIVVGGFVKDVIERKGRDLVKCGIFSFKVNLSNNTVAAKTAKFFDDAMLTALESNARRSRYFKYKLDYIMPIGDAVYYIGEQYNETFVQNNNNGAMGRAMGNSGTWQYEYMDVIIGKLNAKGEFEWVKNVPLRVATATGNMAHVFKQYIAYSTSKNLYILCDDHPKNMERYEKADFEAKDLKTVSGIHGSNFVCNTVNLGNGSVSRKVVFENENFCFAPIQERNPQFMPPAECEIFVPSKNNEIFIYTEDRGQDQFGRLKFD